MAPKRKATGPPKGNPAKRIASGVNTPRSDVQSNDDEYMEEGDKRFMEKLSFKTYVDPQAVARPHLPGVFRHDFSYLALKPDHADRPLWVDPDRGRIIMESFSSRFKEAESFLINIAEPQSRVSLIHEYTLTPHSLFAAVSVGLTTDDIISNLESLSKTPLAKSVVDFITTSTKSFGKVRLVLKHTKYWIESNDAEVLQTLLRDSVISQARITSTEIVTEAAPKMGALVISGTSMAAGAKQAMGKAKEEEEDIVPDANKEADAIKNQLLDEDEDEQADQVHSFEIAPESVQEVSKRCKAIDLPLTEEYDFRNDYANANLKIDLKPGTQIRYYQEKALHKMFGNGRARSGIIVLPCGAGKTLVGITAACTVQKGIVVLATSTMSVIQWKSEFMKWANIAPEDITTFISGGQKEPFRGNTGVMISTYNMIAQAKGRSHHSQKMMDFIENREWGLMILDEVHVVPAKMFQKVTYKVKSHTKLGLTATLLREDDKIQELNFLIGPKLFEANWQELSEQGHIAKVQCAEVWCPMTSEFYSEYLKAKTTGRRNLLFTLNPRKFQACQYLIKYHEARGDRIIVFSDNVVALQHYARKMDRPFIFGETGQEERQRLLENFQYNEATPTIFLSKIGDTSLDLPEATCLIQISSHYGSRRQEAQRLGRILRAKRRNDEGFNAFFYSLVSKDTAEMYYSSKRQAFLVDQGYSFKVITHLSGIQDMPGLAFSTPAERRELLAAVLLLNESHAETEKIEGDLFSAARPGARKKAGGVKRTANTLADLSGGQNMAYAEYDRKKKAEVGKKTKGGAFMKKLKREQERKRANAADFN
ncbi:DNA repair helicase rad25 [Microthyrium microscopicum]|uniref:DNA 3'-5' helicase n=1 Tax=Microthyrium microscopicum TaxID=703497 RepID=A0A6A6TV65_9PEZI|nr:DNA repair helicase rad25 [Microthyrium microscopicum]